MPAHAVIPALSLWWVGPEIDNDELFEKLRKRKRVIKLQVGGLSANVVLDNSILTTRKPDLG